MSDTSSVHQAAWYPTTPRAAASLTLKCLWICALSFQYGYNISALNGLHDVMECGPSGEAHGRESSFIPTCYDMSPFQYGLLSSIYTVGGFFGSLFAGTLADRAGRKRACLVAALCIGIGSGLMVLAPTYTLLVLGRSTVGIGCGIATVIVPTYLSEIAPPERKGSIGVLNQLGIVTGIFTGQAASLGLARPNLWRYVLLVSTCMSLLQISTNAKMQESPVWAEGSHQKPSRTLNFQTEDVDGNDSAETEDQAARQRLLSPPVDEDHSVLRIEPPTTIWGILKSPITRKGLRIVILTQIAQQASGINAVLYFSTDIMKKALPTKAGYIALLITAVNLVMTFPPLYLVDRLGRRPLLLASTSFMSLSSLLLALTLADFPTVSSIAIILFVSSFSIGLGPIPFLIIPEVVPPRSAAALGSLGLGVNWIVNGCVGVAFLPLLDVLGGRGVFLFFAAVLAVATVLIGVVLR